MNVALKDPVMVVVEILNPEWTDIIGSSIQSEVKKTIITYFGPFFLYENAEQCVISLSSRKDVLQVIIKDVRDIKISKDRKKSFREVFGEMGNYRKQPEGEDSSIDK